MALHQEALLWEELPNPPRVEALLLELLLLELRPLTKPLRLAEARWVWARLVASAVGLEAVIEGISGCGDQRPP